MLETTMANELIQDQMKHLYYSLQQLVAKIMGPGLIMFSKRWDNLIVPSNKEWDFYILKLNNSPKIYYRLLTLSAAMGCDARFSRVGPTKV